MKNLKFNYSLLSPGHLVRRDRFQLLAAALGIAVGFSETAKAFQGASAIIPILGFGAAACNIAMAVWYRSFEERYQERFNIFLNQFNGLIMLITGIGFRLSGSRYIQYAYYLLALLFFLFFPYFYLPMIKRRMVIELSPRGLTVFRKMRRPVEHLWPDIESLFIEQLCLWFQIRHKGKSRRYYFSSSDEFLKQEIGQFIQKLKTKAAGPYPAVR